MGWIERLEERARAHGLRPQAQVFYFLRHGETAQNRARICQGQDDVPLNADGIAQAARAAPIIAELPVSRIVASDLMRVQSTVAPIVAQRSWPMTVTTDLRERHFGNRQRQPIRDDHWDAIEPDVETIDAFVDRICHRLRRELTLDHVLLAAHGGVLRVVAAALGLRLDRWAYGNALPLVFTIDGQAWAVEGRSGDHRLDAMVPLPEGIVVGDPTTAADLADGPIT